MPQGILLTSSYYTKTNRSNFCGENGHSEEMHIKDFYSLGIKVHFPKNCKFVSIVVIE